MPRICAAFGAFALIFGLTAVAGASISLGAPAGRAARSSTSSEGNLLTGDQASFTTSTGGWVGTGATLSWAPLGEAAVGALGVTATGDEGMWAASGSPSSGGLVPATAGMVYTGSAASEAPSTAQEVEPLLAFYDSAGNLLTTVFGPETQAATGSWSQLTPVSALAPTDTASLALFLEVPTTTGGDEVYFDDAWVQQSPDDVPAVAGPLHTSGNQIVDADGNPIMLHGVVLDGLEYSSAAPNVTEQAVVEAKDWGANIVRVPLGEQFWISSNCDHDPDYSSRVAQVVNWITSLGMVALLDLHWNTVGGCETGSQHNMADEAQSPQFWSEVASQFGSNPLVAFDLYNEPHNISDSVWLNGGPTTDYYSPYQTYQAAGMQQLYDSVRSTGAQNLVFVSGNNWANTVPSTLVSGTNIVYAVHDYTCPEAAPPNCGSSDPYDPSPILDNWVAVSASVPVMVTEFGWPSQYDGTYNANVISLAEQHGWGWIAFSWQQDQYPTIWDLASDWLSDGTAEPAASGMPVLCALAEAASGTSLCESPPPAIVPSPPTTTQATGPTTGSAALAYTALSSPVRIADTRPGATDPPTYAGETLGPGGSLVVALPADLPADSGAIVAQLTAIEPTAGGYLTAYPSGSSPGASNVNFVAGQIVGNLVTVGVGLDADGRPSVTIYNGPSGDTDFTLDLYGYYAPQSPDAGAAYTPITPTRIFDTRNGSGLPGAGSTLGPGTTVNVRVAGETGVPSSASAVVLNIAVTNTTASSYLEGYPTGDPLSGATPTVDQNWTAGETLSTQAILGVGSDGSITLENAAGTMDVVIDLDGYFGAPGGSGSLFTPLANPVRLLDTRSSGGPVPAGSSTSVEVGGSDGLPPDVTSAALNVADIAAGPNYLTAYPAGASVPNAANVNYTSADASSTLSNGVYATIGTGGDISFYDSDYPANIVVDEFGYFAPSS